MSNLLSMLGSIELGVWDWLAGVSYGLLAVSYLMRDMRWLRVVAIAAAALDLAIYYNIRPEQPMWVQLGFSAVFIGINAYQLYALWRDGRVSHFQGYEKLLFDTVFNELTPGEFRRLMTFGAFAQLHAGAQVLEMGKAVQQVTVLVEGEFAVATDRHTLAHIRPGSFVGEMGYVTGMPASVSVSASQVSQVFGLPCANLDALKARHPELHGKITGLMGRDIAEKLRSANTLVDKKMSEVHVAHTLDFAIP